MEKITFVLTSCGRNDLLEKTLDSFFKYNTYPIERYIIVEDSSNPEVFKECEKLNREKYNGKLEFIFNYEKLGQSASIDKAYSMVETEYIFHCEEDWEFYRSGFIENSIKVLKSNPKILQGWIRPKSDKILNKIESKGFKLDDNITIRKVLPCSFKVKKGNEDGSDMVIKDYMGFSWNPGVKRLRDWKILPNGYSEFEREHLIDKFYKDNGYYVVSISENDEQGYVKHLGWGRRADNPVFKKEVGISVIMPSFLKEYSGSRKNPEDKFKRAVKSFKNQSHNKKELIIISDGCEITNEIYQNNYLNDPEITIVKVEKRKEKWPGELREVGRSISKYNWITYLDSDDYILKDHLKIISKNIKDLKGNETVIFNMKYGLPILNKGNDLYYKFVNMGKEEFKKFSEKIKPTESLGKLAWAKSKNNDHVGTWQITHHKYISTRWKNSPHMGEDTYFIQEIKKTEKWKEFVGRYVVCHVTNNRKPIWDI